MSLQEKKLAVHIKIETFYRKLHTGELDNLPKLVAELEELTSQVKKIASGNEGLPA